MKYLNYNLTMEENEIVISVLSEHKDRIKEGLGNVSSGRLETTGSLRQHRLILGLEKTIKQLDSILLKLAVNE